MIYYAELRLVIKADDEQSAEYILNDAWMNAQVPGVVEVQCDGQVEEDGWYGE